MSDRHSHFVRDRRLKSSAGKRERERRHEEVEMGKKSPFEIGKKVSILLLTDGRQRPPARNWTQSDGEWKTQCSQVLPFQATY